MADRGIVVWYDPDKEYESFAKSLAVDEATVLIGGDGFFRLRERMEPLLEFVTPDGAATPNRGVPPNVVVTTLKTYCESGLLGKPTNCWAGNRAPIIVRPPLPNESHPELAQALR